MSFAKKAPVVTGGIVAIVGLSLSHGAHAVGSGDLIDTGQRLGEGEVTSTALEIGDFDGDGGRATKPEVDHVVSGATERMED